MTSAHRASHRPGQTDECARLSWAAHPAWAALQRATGLRSLTTSRPRMLAAEECKESLRSSFELRTNLLASNSSGSGSMRRAGGFDTARARGRTGLSSSRLVRSVLLG